jgi:hypothetical protein
MTLSGFRRPYRSNAVSVASSVYLYPNVDDPDVVPFELEKKLGLLKAAGVTILVLEYISKISKERR